MYQGHSVGVVVPAYNERELIGETLTSIPIYVDQIYAVDDGSTDGTCAVIERRQGIDQRIVCLRHERNKGVGAAIITGYQEAIAQGMDIIAVMAGDNQMDPDELPRLLGPIVEGMADYTKGNRLLYQGHRVGMSRWRYFGNTLLTFLTRIGSGYWHWIFFINVPFGILSIFLLQKYFHENIERKKQKIDYAGIIMLSAAIIILLVGVPAGGKKTAISIALTLVTLIIFYFIEKKASEPIVPFDILTKSSTVVNTISFLTAAVLIGADVYIPLYIQNVLGYKATISGLSMAPMSVSWLIASVIIAKMLPKYGERIVIASSIFVIFLSCLLLLQLGIESSLIMVIICTFIMGFGFGGSFPTLTIVIQASVNYNKRGAATALNSLVRTIGHTIGVAIFGSIVNRSIVEYFNNLGIEGIDPNDLYSTTNMPTVSMHDIQLSISSSLHIVFLAFICITVACIALSFLLPSKLKGKDENETF
jgi:glycosyltransferase involved in cell wall biosynthesis